ncbi:MAG TPA: transposase, partial [Blastococcus sp.]
RTDARLGELGPAGRPARRHPWGPAVAAQMILAEVGTDRGRFPTPAHQTSWARCCPGCSESAGRKKGDAGTGTGNRYLARVVGDGLVVDGRTDTFLGQRYRRIARRRGKKGAIMAVGRACLCGVRSGRDLRRCLGSALHPYGGPRCQIPRLQPAGACEHSSPEEKP